MPKPPLERVLEFISANLPAVVFVGTFILIPGAKTSKLVCSTATSMFLGPRIYATHDAKAADTAKVDLENASRIDRLEEAQKLLEMAAEKQLNDENVRLLREAITKIYEKKISYILKDPTFSHRRSINLTCMETLFSKCKT